MIQVRDAELTPEKLNGCGLLIINLPFTLDINLAECELFPLSLFFLTHEPFFPFFIYFRCKFFDMENIYIEAGNNKPTPRPPLTHY